MDSHSSATGVDAPEPTSEPAPNYPHRRNRPHTPDEAEESNLHEPNRPPTPESISDLNSSASAAQYQSTPSSPPVPLAQRTWATPQPIDIKKVRMKAPRGIPEHNTMTESKWTGTLRRIGDVYTYTRLPHNEVRLMLLKPGCFDDDIYISLITVNDTDIGSVHFPYCALSYHWGEGEFNNTVFIQEDARSQPLRTIKDVVDAKRPKKLKIKPNLCEVLKRLRDEEEIVSLWVDAICINQFDEEEKNEQVMKMALIYSKAYNVNIWLGSDDPVTDIPVSDAAMGFIPLINNPNIHGKLLNEDIYIKSWACLFELLKWSW
jgi:hypothetical protein